MIRRENFIPVFSANLPDNKSLIMIINAFPIARKVDMYFANDSWDLIWLCTLCKKVKSINVKDAMVRNDSPDKRRI